MKGGSGLVNLPRSYQADPPRSRNADPGIRRSYALPARPACASCLRALQPRGYIPCTTSSGKVFLSASILGRSQYTMYG